MLLLASVVVTIALLQRKKEEPHCFVFLQLTLQILNCLFADVYIALFFNDALQRSLYRSSADSLCNVMFIFCHWVFVYQYLKVALLMPIYLQIEEEVLENATQQRTGAASPNRRDTDMSAKSKDELNASRLTDVNRSSEQRVNLSHVIGVLESDRRSTAERSRTTARDATAATAHTSAAPATPSGSTRQMTTNRTKGVEQTLCIINAAFILFTSGLVAFIQLVTVIDFGVLVVLPLILLSIGLIWSMWRIQKVVKMLKSDEFYSNEKLVYLHIFLFVIFTIVITVEYTCDFIIDIEWWVSEQSDSERYYLWMFYELILNFLKSVVVNFIGYVMLYMLLKYSRSHHKDDF